MDNVFIIIAAFFYLLLVYLILFYRNKWIKEEQRRVQDTPVYKSSTDFPINPKNGELCYLAYGSNKNKNYGLYQYDDQSSKWELLANPKSYSDDVITQEISAYKNAIALLQESLTETENSVEHDVEFDIEHVEVYAIEYEPQSGKTIIGYKCSSNAKIEFHEWNFVCSVKQHNRLVRRLRKKINKK